MSLAAIALFAASSFVDDAAQLYYARTLRHRAAEETLGRRSSIASGIVHNSVDEPIAGASVVVIRVRTVDGQTKFDEIAKGVTDDSGRFAVAAKTRKNEDIGLEVRAPGFMLWRRWAGGTVAGEPIVLNRVIDDAYFADIDREGDRARRLSLLLDLVGRRAWNSYAFDERIEQFYSHIGSIRNDLLDIAQSKAFAAIDNEYDDSPAQRAKNLLIYWFDPHDEALIRAWVKEESFKHFSLSHNNSGKTLAEASAAYADAHFAREGHRTYSYFTDTAFSADCKHAYMVFVVRYANWAYWQPIVMLDDGDRWQVKLVGEGGRWHGLSPKGPARPYPE